MKCPKCSSEIPEGGEFCPKCGWSVTNGPSVTGKETIVPEFGVDYYLAGRYRIIREIGRGGMGVVYLAYDDVLETSVAIKVLPQVLAANPRAIENLKKEARTAMKLRHPNIVALHHFEDTGDVNFFVMEHVEGKSLEQLLIEKETLSVDETIAIGKQIAEALNHAHSQGVVHRDIKPGNILVRSQKSEVRSEEQSGKSDIRHPASGIRAKLVDFGIAREIHNTMTRLTGRQTSGTLLYMSPEQLTGRKLDHRSDIYSFGCTLYEMLTGDPPFATGDITYQHMHEMPPSLRGKRPDVPEWLDNLILQCLRKTPDERPADLKEIAEALESQKPKIPAAGKAPHAPRRGTAKSKRRVSLAVAVIVVLALVLFTAVLIPGSPQKEVAVPPVATVVDSKEEISGDKGGGYDVPVVMQKGLLVESEPPEATITLDGEELAEKTPFLFKDLPSGTHKIKVVLNEYVEQGQSLYYSRGDDRRVKFALKCKTGDILVRVPETGFRIRLIGLDHAGQGEEIAASGTTHIFKDKRIGRYRVATEHEHYDAFVRELAVKYGERVEMTAQNSPHPGSIHIESEPSGAEIFIDDEKQSRGKTPKTIPNLLPGKYKIHLSHPREGDAKEEVIVRSDERASLTIKKFKPRLAAGFRAVESEGRDEKTGLWKEIVHKKSGIVLRLVPAGEFDMGSPDNEKDRDDDEGPVHRVKISKPFYIGKYEVTQRQWVVIMGNNPSRWKGDSLPVEKVSWNKVKEFCRKAGGGLRLPTEAEWEYACRAGTTTPFNTGANITTDQANYDGNYPYGGGDKGKYRKRTTPVGTFKPNAWGLYDMHGNVWEWCEDVWHPSYDGAPDNGSAWTSGRTQSRRVLRGGSWSIFAGITRSANRNWFGPGYSNYYMGFRVMVSLRAGK